MTRRSLQRKKNERSFFFATGGWWIDGVKKEGTNHPQRDDDKECGREKKIAPRKNNQVPHTKEEKLIF